MNDLIGFLNWFTGNQWISLVAVVLGVVAIVYTAIPVHAARKQRRLEAARNQPGVKATINRTPSVDNWRSIQLHITPPEAQAQTFVFQKSGWRIRNAKLISPRNTELAFARDDDHSLKGPVVGISDRLMSGRADNHLQPFAMEFFIRFPDQTSHSANSLSKEPTTQASEMQSGRRSSRQTSANGRQGRGTVRRTRYRMGNSKS